MYITNKKCLRFAKQVDKVSETRVRLLPENLLQISGFPPLQ